MKRSIITLVLTFVSGALLATPASAQAQQDPPDTVAPDSARHAAAAHFRADHGATWQIRWSAETGTPATLMSGKARGYGGPPEQAGRAFLEDHARLFGIENAQRNLRVARQNSSQNGSARVLYQQVYQDVPVLASGYLVSVNEAGEVYYVSGDYYPDIKLPSVTPQVSAQAVVRLMQDDLDAAGLSSAFAVLKQPELVVYVDRGDTESSSGSAAEALSYHLAYVAEAERRDPFEAFKYVIDAQTSAVLYKTSLIEDAGRHGFGGKTATTDAENARTEREATSNVSIVDGSGEVYRTNPLHGSPVTKTLHRLRDRSPRELYGYDVDINDRFDNDATSSSGAFDYSPSNFRFDQVMVYYHSDEFEAWLGGRLNWNDNTGEVDAETRSTRCYACTVPSREDAFYSDGSNSSNRNPTREASVMAHEQMHIVSEKYDDLNHDDDGDALDEGYSDYFAVAYRHDWQNGQSTEVGEYALPGTNRELDNDFDDRSANNDDNGSINFYDASLVFSGALWDFTTNVASDVEEGATITLSSLGHLDADPSFVDARNALIAAANDAGHSYTCAIRTEFAAHGIGSECLPPSPSVYVSSGPIKTTEGRSETWTAYASGGSGSYRFSWYTKSGPGEPFYGTCAGAETSCTTSFPHDANGTIDQGAIRVFVTDVVHGTHDSDERPVTIYENGGGGGGGGGGCNGATTNAICFSTEVADGIAGSEAIPEAFALDASYPNPVHAGQRATIPLALPKAARVEVALFDMLGREVRRIESSGQTPAGHHRVVVGTEGLSSGVYVYRVRAGEGGQFSGTGKLVVVK